MTRYHIQSLISPSDDLIDLSISASEDLFGLSISAPEDLTTTWPGIEVKMVAELGTQRQKGSVKGCLIIPSIGFKQADPDDIEFMTIVAQVERSHSVVVEVDDETGWLDIFADTKDNLADSMDGFRAALKLEPGGAKAWHPTVLVGPVKVPKSRVSALLDVTAYGARPYMSPKAKLAISDAQYKLLYADWVAAFRKKLFQAAKQIRATPSEMRMRISLGNVLLQEWKKNAEVYTYAELENVVKRLGVRGTFTFRPVLGTAQLAHNLLTKVHISPDIFEPVDTRIGSLRNVKPKHTLILTTANLQVETEVIDVQEADTDKQVLRLGAAKGFRRERRNRAVEIATMCPEYKYDWNLAVNHRVPVASLSFNHDDITRHSRFSRRADPTQFPDFTVNPAFVRAYQMERVMGKTAWLFKLRGSGYVVEVALYRVIATREEDKESLVDGECGVDFFRPSWDEMLAYRDVVAELRPLSDNCNELFPQDEKQMGDRDGVAAMVRRVAEVHGLVSKLDQAPPVTDEPKVEDENLLLDWE